MRDTRLAALFGVVLFAIGLFVPSDSSGQTQQGGGPPGMGVVALVQDPANSNTLYAAGGASRVVKSTDGGATWSPAGTGLTGSILALAIDPFNSVAYVGMTTGFFQSSNGGQSWTASNTGLPTGSTGSTVRIESLAIHPSVQGTLYAVVGNPNPSVATSLGSVYKSTNAGATWAAIPTTGMANTYVLTVAIDSAGTLYAGTVPAGLFKSADGGQTWTSINSFGQAPVQTSASTIVGTDVTAIGIDPSSPGTVYAASTGIGYAAQSNPPLSVFGGVDGLFKTKDGGQTWASITVGLPNLPASRFVASALAVDPTNSQNLYLYSEPLLGVFKSSDGGSSWAPTSGPSLNNGLSNLSGAVLAIDRHTPTTVYAGSATDGIFKTINAGKSWLAINNGLTSARVPLVLVDPANSANVYAIAGSGAYRSSDAGGSWSGINSGLPCACTSLLSYAPMLLAIDPTNSAVLYAVANGNGLYKSTNSGFNWFAASSGINLDIVNSDGIPYSGGVQSVAIDPVSPSTIYVGTEHDGIFKTTDGGASWSAVNNGLGDFSNPEIIYRLLDIEILAVDPVNHATVYAVSGGLEAVSFKSTDGGASWTGLPYLGNGLPNVIFTRSALLIDPSNTATLYFGTSVGVFRSTDGGLTWSAVNAGQGNLNWGIAAPTTPGFNAASPASGATAAGTAGNSVTFSVNPTGLAPGLYQNLFQVSATGAANTPQFISATLNILSTAAPASPQLSTYGLLFELSGGTATESLPLIISNGGGGPLSFNAQATTSSGGTWLQVSPTSGSTDSGSVTAQVSVNPSGLAAGLYHGAVTVTFSTGAQQQVQVALVVTSSTLSSGLQAAATGCTASGLDLLATSIGNGLSLPVSFPQSLLAQVFDNCGGAVNTATVSVSVEGLTIVLQPLGNGLYSGVWTPQQVSSAEAVTFLAVHPTLGVAQHTYSVATSAPAGGVELPSVLPGGVVGAAAFPPLEPLAPGSIVAIFGSGFASSAMGTSFGPDGTLVRNLNGVSVIMGSENAPLYFVSPGQINAQVPFDLPPGQSVSIVVSANGQFTAPQQYSISPVQPAIFTAGTAGVVLNGNGLITASNPAHLADVLTIYANALGLTNPTVATGAPSPATQVISPVTVTIGGVQVPVQYQGLTPTLVGLNQINVALTGNIPTGDAIPLVVTQNGLPANTVFLPIH